MKIIAGIKIPDSAMARAATELIRDTESDLLFHHSTRVFLFGALVSFKIIAFRKMRSIWYGTP
jgi:hypothetical protein